MPFITEDDIDEIISDFAAHNWNKPRSTFESYLSDQQKDERRVWLAWRGDDLAGYVTLSLNSKYEPFREASIPEIMDLNVLPPFRNNGIGSSLLDLAEKEAFQAGDKVGLGVGLYDGYGAAHKLYISRGYMPDGLGITYDYKRVAYGERVALDDDLVLWMVKGKPIGDVS